MDKKLWNRLLYKNSLVNEIEGDKISGGKGDKLNPKDVDPKELEIGVAVEKEHTDDEKVATEIALDHLSEKSDYYSKLVKAGIVDEKEALDIYKKYFGRK